MHINCPNCQCKGLVDTAPLLNKARIVCVRCGTAYDALLVDGAVETTVVATGAQANLSAEPAQADVLDAPAVPDIDADDVLALPHSPEAEPQSNEHAVLDFAAPPQTETAPATHTEHTEADAPVQPSVTPTPERDDLEFDLMHDSGVHASVGEHTLPLSRALLERQREQDKYSMGVRLLRVSPLWLLVCGFGFIFMVVALNGLTSSAEQLNSASSSSLRASVPVGNQASNQSAAHNPRPTNNPPAHVEPTEQQTEPHEAAATAQPTSLPSTPQQSAAAAPHKDEPVQPVAQPIAQPTPNAQPIAQNEAGGRFTLQVGSYADRAQADERAAQLQRAGFAAQLAAVEIPKRGTWYRVQTGRFDDRAAAARYGAELRAKGAVGDFIIAELPVR